MPPSTTSDPADPIPLPVPPAHLASRWANGVATPLYLKPLVILVLVATTSAAIAFVVRSRTMQVTVVPAESALTDIAVRALPTDNVLKDYTAFVLATAESWSPDTVHEVATTLNDFIHPTFRDEFGRRQKRMIADIGSLPRSQSAILLATRVAERQEGNAYVDAAVEIQTFVFSGAEPRLSHSEIKIFTAAITADVATEHNRFGLLLRSMHSQSEEQWTKSKLPKFWEDEMNRIRNVQIQQITSGKVDNSP